MGDASYRQMSSHSLTEWCFLLNVLVAMRGRAMAAPGCFTFHRGTSYMGSLDVTETGKKCQSWAENSPHNVDSIIKDEYFPEGSKKAAKNFCRNPDARSHETVWCYTTDSNVEWEYCNICPDSYKGYSGCSLEDKGTGYTGTLAHTRSFRECISWAGHESNSFTFPDGSAEKANNYCRNPNNREAPWCFIGDVYGATWDYCDVCKPFTGTVTVTPGRQTGLLIYETKDVKPLDCIYWCLTFGPCSRVFYKKDGNTCYIRHRTNGNPDGDPAWDTATVSRACVPNMEGKTAYYMEELLLEDSGPNRLITDATKSKCDDACTAADACCFYEYHGDTHVCFTRGGFDLKTKVADSNSVSRIAIRCDPALGTDNSTDGLSTLAESGAGKGEEFGVIVIVLVVIGIISVAAGAFTYYKLVYLKGKGKGKGKDNVEDKAKGKGNDKRKVKGKSKGKNKNKVKGKDKGKDKEKEKDKVEDKDKDIDKGKDKDKVKDEEKDKGKDKEKDKGKVKDENKGKSKDKGNDIDKDKDTGANKDNNKTTTQAIPSQPKEPQGVQITQMK